jgi:hypothetical protein
MEKTQVSTHNLTSDYSIKGKLKTLIIGWIIYLIILIIPRITEVQNVLFKISKDFAFLTSNFWYFFMILMITGTIITLVKKHPFIKINIYNTGIGFIDKNGLEEYFDYEKIKLAYGKMRQSLTIELLEDKKTSYDYAWREFTQADVLKNNLERYSQLGNK